MVYTHDKYGKPIPPQVMDILNRSVPLKPRKKRTASMAASQVSDTDSEYDQTAQMDTSIPPIHDVPDLYSTRSSRKIPCQRIPCDDPLEIELTGDEDDSGNESQNNLLDENDNSHPDSTSIPSPFSWLRSMLSSVRTTTRVEGLNEEKTPKVSIQNDFPERSGRKVPLETFRVSEKPGVTPRSRAPRLNSNFYRVLALENAMCLKGKLEQPNVSMFIQPRNDSCEPHFVLGIQQKLKRRRERRWRELTDEDFS